MGKGVLRFFKEVSTIVFAPILVVGLAALVLGLLGLVSPSPQKVGFQRYQTVEELERALNIKVLLPAYFPDYLLWPPAMVQGQQGPAPSVELLFLSRKDDKVALSLRQIGSESELSKALPRLNNILKEYKVTIDSTQGVLMLLKSAPYGLYNHLYWQSGAYYLIMATSYPIEELFKIAQSIRP